MSQIIQARLDKTSEQALKKLCRHFNTNTSTIVREALKTFASLMPNSPSKKIIGLGKFKSGISDLASNKKHLEGFGR